MIPSLLKAFHHRRLLRYIPIFSLGLFTTLLVINGCGTTEQTGQLSASEHQEMVDTWHNERVESIQERDGWMKLAGLYWLDEGENTFGTADKNDVRFPEGTVPEQAGYFMVEGSEVSIHLNEDLDIKLEDGSALDSSTIFTPDEAKRLVYDRLLWTVIQREDKIGIRLFDEESPYYTSFTGFDRYPVDLKWRVEAEFVPHEDRSSIAVTNILGQTVEDDSPGKLVFEIDGEEYSLDVLDADDSFFIPFGDETNRGETYGSGRYIYTDTPDDDGKVIIDFNKSYNPPCAYNPYTTCQLPPDQNRLSIAVTAGEKDYTIPVD